MVRSGCAAIGGGLCLVSNALFAFAVGSAGRSASDTGTDGAAIRLRSATSPSYVDLWPPRTGSAILGYRAATCRGRDTTRFALRVELARAQTDEGHVRDTRIRRRVWHELALLEDRFFVNDHQRIPAALRTCLDCGETACHARVTIPGSAR
jgi:vancomycin resistance protein VanW